MQVYPYEVGRYLDFIEQHWMGHRVADCVGLIKGYGWLNVKTGQIVVGSNGMPDLTADGMHNAATIKGNMSTMADKPGLAVWMNDHIGVYVGGGNVVEAMGTKHGVVETKLQGRGWLAWIEVPSVSYG